MRKIFILLIISMSTHWLVPARVSAQRPEDEGTPGIRYMYSINAKASGMPLVVATGIWMDRVNGELYIIDPGNNRVVVTDAEGTFLYQFKFEDAGLPGDPNAIAVNKKGDLYVSVEGRLFVLDYRGEYKREIELGSMLGAVFSVQSIYFDPQDEYLYLGGSGRESGRVLVLDKMEKLIFSFSGNFRNVYGLQANSEGIYFLDPAIFQVFHFNKKGELIKQFGGVGETGGGFSMPQDLIVDDKGRIAVLDANRTLILFFNKETQFLVSFGGKETFERPRAMSFFPGKRLLFVADQSGYIRVFRVIDER